MVWGLGAYSKGRADREKENRAIRAENARLYQEYIRLNPDISAEQSDAYASQLADGSEYFRSMLPSKDAMQNRVTRRKQQLAAAAAQRARAQKQANLSELQKAGELFSSIAIGSKDMETAKSAFSDMGGGVFSDFIISKDGTINPGVVGLGTRLAKTEITPEVMQYMSQWQAEANPTQVDSVLNRITNKDLRSPFQAQMNNMVQNKKTSLINKLPDQAQQAAERASITDTSAQDVQWDKLSSALAPWVAPNELQQLKEQKFDPFWKAYAKRRSEAIDGEKQKAVTTANDVINKLDAEQLRQFQSVRELESFIINEVRKNTNNALAEFNVLEDIDENLKAQIEAKRTEIRSANLNTGNQREEQDIRVAIANQQDKSVNPATKNAANFNEALQKVVASQMLGGELNDEKIAVQASNIATQLQLVTQDIAGRMMLDITDAGYYMALVNEINNLSEVQQTDRGINTPAIRMAMLNLTRSSKDAGEYLRVKEALTLVANSSDANTYNGNGLVEVTSDDSLFDIFMLEYQKLTTDAIRDKIDIIPNDVAEVTSGVIEDQLNEQRSEIKDLLEGQDSLKDDIDALRSAIDEGRFIGETQILEDNRDNLVIIEDAISSIDSTVRNYNLLLNNPDITNFPQEEQLKIKTILDGFQQLRSDLASTRETIKFDLNRYGQMALAATTTTDPTARKENSADFFVAKINELKTSGKTTTELGVEAEQLVDEMIATFDLNDLLRETPKDQSSPAWNFYRGIVRGFPLSGDVLIRPSEAELKLTLVDMARDELGLTPLSGRELKDTDKYGGFSLLNLIEEIGQNITRPAGDAISGFFTAPSNNTEELPRGSRSDRRRD